LCIKVFSQIIMMEVERRCGTRIVLWADRKILFYSREKEIAC